MWGFWDGRHWCQNAPLFERDWTPKPALATYRDLVFDEWWSEAEAVTDAEGRITLRVFKGDHRVTIHAGDEPVEAAVAIRAPTATQTISIRP